LISDARLGLLARTAVFAFTYPKNPIGETPKNLKTLPSIDVRKLLPTAGWVELQRSVFKLLDRLDALDSQTIEHPIYGKVHTEDFSALIRHHTAHHFHQFGLI